MPMSHTSVTTAPIRALTDEEVDGVSGGSPAGDLAKGANSVVNFFNRTAYQTILAIGLAFGPC